MAQILDPLPSDDPAVLLCCYVNVTSKIQVARITNVKDWYFERVVFPGQRLLFESVPSANLEIHTGMMASAILSDTIPCERLTIGLDGEPGEYGGSANGDKPADGPAQDSQSALSSVSS
ncbi:MAG: DUF1830 domain-containing protein [Cyanobacteria bacterium J06626_6]